jgi:hypothetical protein
VPGTVRFAKLVEDAAVRQKVREFVRENSPPPTFLERSWLPIGGGVLVVALVIVGVAVLRKKKSTTTVPDVSAGS